MRELAFLITGLSEDDARKLRRRRPSRAPARVVGWALLGVALLYLLAGGKPAVEITSPASGTTTLDAQILVAGRATGIQGDAVTLEVNGSPQTVPVLNGSFEAQVSLVLGDNAIRVSQGDAVSKEVVVKREPLPVVIQILSPQNGSTQDSPTKVTGTITNPQGPMVTLSVNGFQSNVPITNGSFASDVDLEFGDNHIQVSQGDDVSPEVVVNRPPLPILIEITSPRSGAMQASSAKLRGTITNPRSDTVTLTVNGVARSLAITNGSFASDVDLAFGDNHIRVSQGEAVSPEVVVNRPLPPILIEITSPRSHTIQASSGNSSMKVSGTIKNQRSDTVTLTVNGLARSLSIENRRFGSDVDLTIGDNHIQASQGEAFSKEVVVNLLKPKTLIAITSPRSSKTQSSSVTVTGTVTNPSSQTITLTVNGLDRKVTTAANDSFEEAVNLEVGENRIQASQNDSLSNEVIMVRQPPPSIKITSPPGGSVSQSVVTVTGRVENAPGTTIKFTVNGSSRNVRITDRGFTAEATLIPGENLIEASVKGASDRITLVRPKITIDTPKVRIIIDAPKNGEITEQRVRVVSGRVENGEAKGITLTLNGNISPVSTGPGGFQSKVTLLPGKNSIRASLGNASDEVTVTLQVKDVPPEEPPDVCSKIDCDCKNVKRAALGFAGAGSILTAGKNESPPTSTASAANTPQAPLAKCSAAEDDLKAKCKASGKVSGACPPGASGPSAWPPPKQKRPASSPRVFKKSDQMKEKEGVNKP